jgi:hypothetical protein
MRKGTRRGRRGSTGINITRGEDKKYAHNAHASGTATQVEGSRPWRPTVKLNSDVSILMHDDGGFRHVPVVLAVRDAIHTRDS